MCVFVSKEKRKKVKLYVLLTVIKFDVHPNIIYFLHCNSHIHTRTLLHAWPAHILQLNLSFAFDNYPLMHGSSWYLFPLPPTFIYVSIPIQSCNYSLTPENKKIHSLFPFVFFITISSLKKWGVKHSMVVGLSKNWSMILKNLSIFQTKCPQWI